MLIDFKVKNFLSYKDLQTFSMVKGSTVRMNERVEAFDDVSLLKFGAIYGANAAGKSNLVKAILYMKELVTLDNANSSLEVYFKLDEHYKNIPSYFEVTVKLGASSYAYGFEFNSYQHKFTSEWLCQVDGKIKYIFNRNISEKTNITNYDDEKWIECLGKVDFMIEENELLLPRLALSTKLNESKYLVAVKNMYFWFQKKLMVTTPESTLTNGRYFMDGNKLNDLAKALKSFDTGIEEIKAIEYNVMLAINDLPTNIINRIKEDYKKSNFKENFSVLVRANNDLWIVKASTKEGVDVDLSFEKICFFHKGSNIPLTLKNESDGTIRIMDLIEVLLNSDDDTTYVIDELDRCLHPQLTCKFIKEFLKFCEKRKIQLIVTTHESRLLDFEILRRDEIWFTEKKNNESTLYSLEEFDVRCDKKLDKAYLNGRFGGVPLFDTLIN